MAKPKPPVFDEIAVVTRGRDVTRGYLEPLDVVSPQDEVLSRRGSGDLRVYESVLRDDQVEATFGQRRLAVVSREWDVIPGGKRKVDAAAADFLRETLREINFDNATDKMLYGVFYGYSVGECLWGRDGRHVILDKIKVRRARRFRFDAEENLRLLTMGKPQGEPVPDRKFWTFRHGSDNDDEPYGLGLAHWLYWPVFFKRNGLKFWLIFLEKFGQPTPTGKYPANATETDKRRLLEAVTAVHVDAGIIMPESMVIELLEAARSGTADYSALCDRMDRAISKVILGQTMTTDSGSSRAQAEVHLDVRHDIVKADADLLCQSFNTSVARWLTEWNYPDAEPPTVWRSLEDSPDLSAQAEREKTIVDMGVARPTLKHIQDTYGGEWEPIAAPQAPGPGEAPAPQGAAFAEPEDAPWVPEAYADRLDAEAAPAMDALLDQVRDLFEGAASLQELRDKIVEMNEGLDPSTLGTLIQRAMVAAELAGRAEVVDETS